MAAIGAAKQHILVTRAFPASRSRPAARPSGHFWIGAVGILALCAGCGESASAGTSHVGGPGQDAVGVDAAAANVGVFAAEVVSKKLGEGSGWGTDELPDIVLGAPRGGGENKGGLHVLSLGKGGEIVLRLRVAVIDGPGPDLIVFENPFVGWVETGRVAVSDDLKTWHTFPCACDDKAGGYPGCAGVSAVLSNADNGIDPSDPKKAGGDAFDLADLGVATARYVKVTDTGKNEYDGKTGGFDLDAISVVHASPN